MLGPQTRSGRREKLGREGMVAPRIQTEGRGGGRREGDKRSRKGWCAEKERGHARRVNEAHVKMLRAKKDGTRRRRRKARARAGGRARRDKPAGKKA